MLKLKLPEGIMDSGLAMPQSTPKTLIQVDSENLPYACQCPLCGGLFNIPEGLLYKIEEDAIQDGDFIDEESADSPDVDIDMVGPGESESPETNTPPVEAGEGNDTFV